MSKFFRPFLMRGTQDFNKRTFIEKLIYAVALFGPLSSVTQIWEIWVVDKSAQGVSVITWGFFLITSATWLWYGLQKKDLPVIISNFLWVIAEAVILVGAVYYDNDFL